MSRRFRFSHPRSGRRVGRRRAGRPRGRRREAFPGPARLREERPATDEATGGKPAGRIPVRAHRPETALGNRRYSKNKRMIEQLNVVRDAGLRESAMPPRYGSAHAGGSRGTAYVDNACGKRQAARAQPAGS